MGDGSVTTRSSRLARLLLAVGVLAYGATAYADLVLRLGNGGEPETLDPHRYNLRLEETILSDLFLGLTTFDPHGKPMPGAAERWEVSEDGKTWTFYLRQGLEWSDGTPVTAEDFLHSLRRTLNPQTAASLAHFLYPIRNAKAVNRGEKPLSALGVEAKDARTLVVELETPYPFFAERLMYPTAYPVPHHALERLGDAWVKAGNMVSNGAYVLAEWVPHSHVRLIRNPHFYAADTVAVDEALYYPSADANTAFNRFRTGDLQAIGNFPSGQLVNVKQSMTDSLRLSPLLSIMYLVFNVTQAPFDDVRVREALALAIDRAVLTDKVLRTGDIPSWSFVPQMVEGYDSVDVAHKDWPRARRLERARTLLAQAGFSHGEPLEFTLRYITSTDNKKVHVALAAMWKEIGVDAQLFHTELKIHFADLRQGDFQVAQAGWFGENNPGHYLGLLESGTGNVNYGRYASAAYDAFMKRAIETVELKERLALMHEAEALAMQELPVIPLYSVMIRSLVNPRITGWVDNARNVHSLRYLGWK